MRSPGRGLSLVLALVMALAAAPAATPRQSAAVLPPALAYRVIDLASGRALASARDDLLRIPVLPGSIAKIATLIAALESGAIQPATRIACPRRLEVEGYRLDCSHPDIGRPLTAAEALAHSCNGYFAAIARRIRREDLDQALVQLGLPASSPSASLTSAALGLGGTRLSPEQLLAAVVRLTTSNTGRVPDAVRAVVIEGLRGAAAFGTAAAFREWGLTALAKTGTAPMPGGGYEGLLVAVTPADRPARAVVVMAPGGAGIDAAHFAVDVLATIAARARVQTIRIGVARRAGGYDVVALSLEDYVSRVVSGEADPASGVEARKALAVAVRTFALHNRSRHARDGFDLCDLTHCQFMGVATAASDAAARATEGEALYYQGRLAEVYYTASCGGHTERPSRVWEGAADPPYLPARAEAECAEAPPWKSDIPIVDLQRALVAAGRRGELLRNLEVAGRTASGRVDTLRLDGLVPPEIGGGELRLAVGRTLGWQVLKSTLFDVARTAEGYSFRGRGRGHGVGMCMAGASRMAAAGQSARAILAKYFPGTEARRTAAAAPAGAVPQPAAAPRPIVVLPANDERERGRIDAVGASALREYSHKLGLAVPGGIRIVAHPTVEAYTRATGQPWWTAGATRGLRVDLIPLASLRQRGAIESTLRHELAHVMTADRLGGRPIWVQEAVAMDLAGDARFASPAGARAAGPAGAGPCPTDEEWRRLRSADDLQDAYRRAAACYASRRVKGTPWDEVR